jgi:polysaccharide biosynthesis transport protein
MRITSFMHEPALSRTPRLPGASDPVPVPGGLGDPDAIWPFFEVLGRRRWLVLGIFLLTLATVAALTVISPKAYTTHAELLAGASGGSSDPSAQTTLPVLNALLAASNTQSSETYIEMLRGTPVVARTISDLRLPITPTRLLDHIVVKPIPSTSIVDLAVTWGDATGSERIANGLAASIVGFRRDLVAGQASTVIAELDRQLPPAAKNVRAAADRLARYQSGVGIADAAEQTKSTLAAAAALDQKAAQAQVDEQQTAAQLRVVEAQLAHTPASVANGGSTQPNPIAVQLQTQLAQVDVQLQTALKEYTDSHPTVRNLRAQQHQLHDELARQPETTVATRMTIANPIAQQLAESALTLRSQAAAAKAQLATIGIQRAALAIRIRTLPAQTQRLAKLQSDAKTAEFVYGALQQKRSDAAIAATTTLSDVTLIQPASAAGAVVSPSLLFNLVVGAIVGLAIALAGAVVVDFLDGSVKTEDDVEERLALPVLSTVPLLGSGKKPPAKWIESVMIESILQLVTSLRYASSEGLHTVAFTSASPGEGKSTVAMAAAIAYASITPRALIVDADLRCATLHRNLGLPNDLGLSDALVGNASFRDVVRPTKHTGLDAVTSGTKTPNPAGLLQSPAFGAFLAEARREYAMVVVDATACGGIVDASLICSRVDGTVFVLARNETDVRAALKAMRRLRGAGVVNLLGAVLNKVVPRKSEIGPYGTLAADGSRVLPLPPDRRDGQQAGRVAADG